MVRANRLTGGSYCPGGSVVARMTVGSSYPTRRLSQRPGSPRHGRWCRGRQRVRSGRREVGRGLPVFRERRHLLIATGAPAVCCSCSLTGDLDRPALTVRPGTGPDRDESRNSTTTSETTRQRRRALRRRAREPAGDGSVVASTRPQASAPPVNAVLTFLVGHRSSVTGITRHRRGAGH